jgi:starch synthase
MHILMLAAENGALPGGKVGGMGDVIRDISPAVAALGHQVTVISPAYGAFCHLPDAELLARPVARFRGAATALELYQLTHEPRRPGVSLVLLEHPLFSACGAGQIYCDDPPDRPFATDASKFALFCSAAAHALLEGHIQRPDVIHLHDWHSALLAVLLRSDPRFRSLADIPLVFTIHNLALQGIRPLDGDESSLKRWFPELAISRDELRDPRYPDCFNPMRAAIALCDKVHAVSPSYALEICDEANDSGAGLQADLRRARDAGRLVGILNGCEYPQESPPLLSFYDFMELARLELTRWIGKSDRVSGADFLAMRSLDHWIAEGRRRPSLWVTSVGRLTAQKVGLLTQRLGDGRSCLEHLLDVLKDGELLLVLGSGDTALESFFAESASRRPQLLFLRGYSDELSEQLYAVGDLFLMPSSFEPCGISQMLAMRAGQLCLVNKVGGLADTVENGKTGFVFSGASALAQAEALLKRFAEALTQIREHPRKTRSMRKAAASKRFEWQVAAETYLSELYTITAVKPAAPRRAS